jgi:hypothetical protein
MLYKTMVLGILEQRPEIYEQLRSRRMLLPTAESYAAELKARHEAWKERLSRTNRGSETQISSEALEIALQELQDRLPSASEGNEPFNLEAAMAFLRRHTPPE